MPGLFGAELGRHRVECVDLRQRQHRQAAVRFVAAGGLQVVQIQPVARRQHHIVALLCCGHCAFDAAPRHHRRTRRHAAFENFIPTDHAPAVLGEVGRQLFVEPALHRVRVLDPELAHLRAHRRRGFPLILHRLIATDVDVGRREQGQHLVQYIGDEGQAAFAGVEQIRVDAPIHAHLRACAGYAHFFGVGSNGCLCMAGHVQFGQHGDVQTRRIGDDLADLFLGVEAAIPLRRAVLAGAGRCAPCAHLGELGIALDLDTPTLIIGEMPMQHVELVQGHRIEHMLDRVHIMEMPGHIQVLAAPAETRPVADRHRRDLDLALARIRCHQLPGADCAIQQAGAIARGDAHALGIGFQAVTFFMPYRRLRAALQADAARRGTGFGAHFQPQPACALQQIGQMFGTAACIGIAGHDRDHRAGAHREAAATAFDLHCRRNQRQRDTRSVCGCSRCARGCNGRRGAWRSLTATGQRRCRECERKQARG